MTSFLKKLTTKSEVDKAIRGTIDKVVVLRFGRENDTTCMLLDEIVTITPPLTLS